MNLDYLKSFYCTAKCNSISKASKELHISQPGLSSQLKKLETELGQPLLDRSNKGVSLTEAGELVFDYAKLIFKLEKNLYNDLQKINTNKNRLSIAACQNFGSFYFSSKIHQFEEIYQDTNITINTYNSSQVLKNILNHDYNLGIIIGSDDCKYLKNNLKCEFVDRENFFEDEFVLCINQSYPKDTISIQEFLQLPIVLREESSCSYALVKEFVGKIGVNIDRLNISFSSNSINITKDSVLNSSACAFFPKSAIEFELEEGLLKKLKFENPDLTPKLSFYYSLIKRNDYTLNPYEQKFEDFILNI